MKLEQVTFDEILGPKDAGTNGSHVKFVALTPIKSWILRQLYLSGAMTCRELLDRLPPDRWTRGGVSGRLSEMTYPRLRLVECRYAPGQKHRLYAITQLGKKALKGEPI